jgi:phage shock protein PspC (stress-responsive transcriptional regulator)
MSDSEELSKLADLHQRGALSDEEFARAKAKLLGGGAGHTGHASTGGASINQLRRSREERWLGGVCGGLARWAGLSTWVPRLAFTLLLLCAGTGVLLYLLLWIFIPQED